MRLDHGETFAQVYLSPSAYHEAFEEEIDIRRWTNIDHHTAGLTLIQKDGRLVLASIVKSTPAAKIPRWRTRCRGAWVMEVNGMPVQMTQDVERALKLAKLRGDEKCSITLAHPEIKDGLTAQGIPQLHIDQFNPRYILNLDHLV
jgi:C-terminal processing protease CtpA/Prc